MAFPLLPVVGLAAVGFLIFGKKSAASAPVSPSLPGGGGAPPYVPPSAPSSSVTTPSQAGYTPGQQIPGAPPGDVYVGPGSDPSQPLGPAADSSGTSYDSGSLSSWWDSVTSGAPLRQGDRHIWTGQSWVKVGSPIKPY